MLSAYLPQGKEVTEVIINARSNKPGVEPASIIRKPEIVTTRKRRRTKGPSEKIRSLAALNLAPKVAYLKLSDLVGNENRKLEALIEEQLPKHVFERGQTIFRAEQDQPVLFLLKSGSIDIFRPSSLGRKFHIKKIEPGTIFGEMPLFGQSMLGARAEAAENSEVASISAHALKMLAAASPIIAFNLISQIGPRLVEAEKQHEQAAFQPVTTRVASLLVSLAGQGNEVSGFTHQEMADVLGVYRETVTNAIAELKEDGLIEVGRKRIILLDPEGLLKLNTL